MVKTPAMSNELATNASNAPSSEAFTIHQVVPTFQIKKQNAESAKTCSFLVDFPSGFKCSVAINNGIHAINTIGDQPISGQEIVNRIPERAAKKGSRTSFNIATKIDVRLN
jgi:hypothetical protein